MPTRHPALPTSMNAAIIRDGSIGTEQRPLPVPGKGEVLVRVHSSALNRADLAQRRGRYPAPTGWPTDIPGLEFSGEVVGLGDGCQRITTGDRVCGLVGGGAHAEYLTTHESCVAVSTVAPNWHILGSTPEAFITAYDALVNQASLRPGERLLVHAAGSGVGLAAIQVAKLVKATVFGTARTPDKLEAARQAGMTGGFAPAANEPDGWVARVVDEWTQGAGVDVVLDLVGGDYTAESIMALAPRGRLMLVGLLAGAEAKVDLRQVLSRRLTVRGTVLRSRSLAERIQLTAQFERELLPFIESGELSLPIDSVFPLARIAEAHERLESNETTGKVVVEVAT